jgi:hypothetical protein
MHCLVCGDRRTGRALHVGPFSFWPSNGQGCETPAAREWISRHCWRRPETSTEGAPAHKRHLPPSKTPAPETTQTQTNGNRRSLGAFLIFLDFSPVPSTGLVVPSRACRPARSRGLFKVRILGAEDWSDWDAFSAVCDVESVWAMWMLKIPTASGMNSTTTSLGLKGGDVSSQLEPCRSLGLIGSRNLGILGTEPREAGAKNRPQNPAALCRD